MRRPPGIRSDQVSSAYVIERCFGWLKGYGESALDTQAAPLLSCYGMSCYVLALGVHTCRLCVHSLDLDDGVSTHWECAKFMYFDGSGVKNSPSVRDFT